jgi:hypothetical protein
MYRGPQLYYVRPQTMLRHAVPVALFLLASCKSASEPPSCATEEILAAAGALQPLAQTPPALSSARAKYLRAVSIDEPELGNDRLQYSAVVDTEAKQVWVYRYGGLAGQTAWFGPLQLPLQRTATCPPARGVIWLGAYGQAVAHGAEA